MRKTNWFSNLGKPPLIGILEFVESEESSEREAWWIRELTARGFDLLNIRGFETNEREAFDRLVRATESELRCA